MDLLNITALISNLALPLISLLIVIGSVIGWLRRRDYLAMMLVVGSIISFGASVFHHIFYLTMRMDIPSIRVLTIAGGLGTFGQILLGIGFLLMMMGQRPRRIN